MLLEISNTLTTWCEELTHWKRPWCWERLGAGEEGDDRGWDGWMASPTRWTWVWVDSGSWWWTGRPGVLRFMGSQRVGHDWVTELNWDWNIFKTYTAKPSATSKTTDYRGKAKRPIERKNRRLKKVTQSKDSQEKIKSSYSAPWIFMIKLDRLCTQTNNSNENLNIMHWV